MFGFLKHFLLNYLLRCLSLVPRFCWAGWESCQLDCVGRGGITVLNLYQGYCVLSRKLSFYFWLLPCSFSFSHQFHLVFFTYSVLSPPPTIAFPEATLWAPCDLISLIQIRITRQWILRTKWSSPVVQNFYSIKSDCQITTCISSPYFRHPWKDLAHSTGSIRLAFVYIVSELTLYLDILFLRLLIDVFPF